MPVRKVGGGPAKVSKVYKPLKSASAKSDPGKFKTVNGANPGKVEPPTPAKSESQETPALAPSPVKLPPPTKLPPPPQERFPTPVPNTFAETATRPPSVPSPITQSLPMIPGPSSGPSTQNWLKSQRSVPTLLNGRPDGRPGSALAASKSNPALHRQTLEPPQLGPDPPLASSANVPGLRSQQTPLPSSLLDNKPTQPSSKVEKQGFFSRLFGFAKSQSKDSKEPRPTKRLSKLPRTSARPMSTALADPSPRLTPGPTTRPASIAMLDSTPRQHAVLVKKPPTVQPTKHSRRSSILPYPGKSQPHQNSGHVGDNGYPQGTTNFESLTPDLATTANATSNAIALEDPNLKDHNRPNTATSSTSFIGRTYGDSNHPYGTNHIQPTTTTDHTQHVGTGKHYDQPKSYTSGDYFGTRDSGYQSLGTTSGYALCAVCNTNPQYTYPNTGKMSPYCSDVCQTTATTATPQTKQAICSYPGCMYPAIMYPPDHYWNYCSESHEHLARKGCIHCRQSYENGTQLCNECSETFKHRAPTIIPVPTDHDAFWNVVDRFTDSWAHPTQCPVVRAVYKIALTQSSLGTYLGYRDKLEYYGQFAAQGRVHGNERILWHGTRRGCNLGETGQTTPCMIQRCSLCSMIRGSFDIDKFATNSSAGRFGTGIYTSTKASKANDYSGSDKGAVTPWKALLLTNVAAGREYVMRQNDTTLKAPPQGYNSVCGEVGGSLNYDELVVYTKNAIRPTWLVMYTRG